MTRKEMVKHEIEYLPDDIVEKVHEYIAFQRFQLSKHKNDEAYLHCQPNMAETIQEGIDTPTHKCKPLDEVWPDV